MREDDRPPQDTAEQGDERRFEKRGVDLHDVRLAHAPPQRRRKRRHHDAPADACPDRDADDADARDRFLQRELRIVTGGQDRH